MRPTIPQVQSWRATNGDILSGLKTAGDRALSNANELLSTVDDCSKALAQAVGWQGYTQWAARQRVDQEADHGREVRNLLLRLSDDALDAHRELGTAATYLLEQVKNATNDQCVVMPSGTVIHPDNDDKAKQDKAADYQRNIISGLDEIERVDGLYSPKLRETQQMLASIINGQPDVTTPDGVRKDADDVVALLEKMSPDERATYLAKLSPEDLRALMIADPVKLGNMNGVPFDTRIAANEINIRNALYYEQRAEPQDTARISQLEKMLAPIPDPTTTDKVDYKPNASESPVDNVVDRKYIMFSNTANGNAIEMIGNLVPGVPGVGVYIPGTTTNLNGSGSNHTAAWNLADKSGGPVFLYMEGDFPQDLTDVEDGAPSPKYSQYMAPMLVEFGHEVDREVAQYAPGTPVSYLGHSYGGSILGTAEQLGLRADRVLYSSSAGTGIYDRPWANANPDVQRYSQTAPGDMIAVIQSAPNEVVPATSFYDSLGNPHAANPVGGDPDEVPGVTRLDTGYYGDRAALAGQNPDDVVFGTDGHGKYWDDPSSTAFQNMVGIIAGTEVTAYVERGIEANGIDVGLGDDGNGAKEAYDAAEAAAYRHNTEKTNDNWFWPFPDRDPDPYANPRVTDNPQLGPKIEVR